MSLLLNATWETIYMVLISGTLSCVFGGLLGIALYVSAPGRMFANVWLHQTLGLVINITRSIPYIIFMIAIIPFTRLLVGSAIGTTAAIVPLTLAAIPFYARIAQSALDEVDSGLIEAINAMGANGLQQIKYVLLPEAMPGLIRGLTITLIALVGYSAMAGIVGGGGLGALAYHYGYQRFDVGVMFYTTAILVVMVQVIQWVGDRIAHHVARGV